MLVAIKSRIHTKFVTNFYQSSQYSTLRNKFNICFFGTDQFSEYSLEKLLNYRDSFNSRINRIDVVTPPDSRTGRGYKVVTPAPLKTYAEKHSLSVVHPPPKKFGNWEIPNFEEKNYDLAIAVSFGYFIPTRVLTKFPQGGLNVHPSLLPKYRGAAPIFHTLINEESETGVTVQELSTEKFDAGKILNQKIFTIPSKPYYLDIYEKLGILGADMLVETIDNLEEFKMNAKTQDSSQITHAKKFGKEYMKINWLEDNLGLLMKKHRVLGWKFALFAEFRKQTIQLFPIDDTSKIDLKSIKILSKSVPGTLYYTPDHQYLVITTLNPKEHLIVDQVHVSNKRKIHVKEFLNGYQLVNGKEILN
ncbi:Formyltransferase [Conidiobolus coronatus NRRL 28638]|uniref:Methionyl-tRNA formyltransferase, mitochondrial n=1 Tax=Conidiobolus coronatus (strain ATCC 28846 / CBS 209.66 / NRRL 28638) TaxID=796925 RepID=A0A137PJ77_CONC2|nr:Formyltransferase [Conidiobolus coronatus NRRL 28638]|eukprot:KXN75054.1 Formyltransferase [Conidiobolus coronatus NRRL 28638]